MLSNAPGNASARQGLNVIVSKLVLQARAELDKGNLDTAEELLADTSAMGIASDELAAALTALQTARDAIAERARRAEEARRQQEAERRAAAQREEAERLAAAEAEAETEAEAEAARQGAVDNPTPETAAATNDQEATDAQAAVQGTPVEPDPVALSSLTRIRYVAPKYPRAAERRGESGWVDIIFTVTMDGTVRDVEVRDSMPAGVFDQAAVRAAEKWEFEPVIEDGRTVEKRAGVRLMFALE